ncbi:MAG: hypothetical protein LYZ69_08360 [Nitrososphaerales archaeon]|nr:hypothetical protein [Nitrososphaerales archaeon]
MDDIVTFRVSKRLKERMARLAHINWSELLRRTLESTVREEESKQNRERDFDRMKLAAQEMDRLATLGGASGWVGSNEVIEWRRKRFSYSTRA